MSLQPKGTPEGRLIAVDIMLYIYLRGREDPVSINATYEIPQKVFDDDGAEVRNLMQVCLSHVLSTLDVVREHRYLFSDKLNNKFVFLTDEVQAISIMAPDEAKLLTIISEALEDG